jgi:hypothetical protein
VNRRLWLDVPAASEHAGHHPVTLRRALMAEELHGTQRTKKGRWRIHVDCLDAWLLKQPCLHHESAKRQAS